MKDINNELWDDLEKNLPTYGYVNAKRILEEVNLFLAVDHNGFRHILLLLENMNQAFTDDKSRGLKVSGRDLEIEGRLNPFLDVECTYKNGHDAYNLIVSDILRNVIAGVGPIDAVKNTLTRWRRFWASTPGSGLSREQLIGLFGELWFLLVWILPYGVNYIKNWVGPNSTRHDFQWSVFSVEAKATESIRGHIHHINNIDQLEPPENGMLYLFSLRIREEPFSTNSLVSIIERICSLIIDNPSLLDLFEDHLAKAGYSPFHAEKYSEIRFRIVSERLYIVDDVFPRLSISSFRGGVPRGVEKVEYEINLETCPELVVGNEYGTLKMMFDEIKEKEL